MLVKGATDDVAAARGRLSAGIILNLKFQVFRLSFNCYPRFCTIFNTRCSQSHYSDVIMGAIESQITSLTIVYSTDYSGADQGKHQSSASLAFVCGEFTGDR